MGVIKTIIKYAIPFVVGFYIGGCDREIGIERRYNLIPKNVELRLDYQPSSQTVKLDGLERVLEKYNGGR